MRLLPSGGSVGDGYGPMIVATHGILAERNQAQADRRFPAP